MVDESLLRVHSPTGRSTEDDLLEISTLYADGIEEVRFKIVNALPLLPSDFARSLAVKALKHDESALVRHEAAFVIGAIGAADLEDVLCDTGLKDTSFLVRHEAAVGKATTPDPRFQLF